MPSLALELASPRAAPAGPLQAATLPLSRRSRWPSFLPGRLPLRPPSPSAGIQLQLLLATASPPSPLLSCQSALTSFRADAVDRIYVGVAVAAVQVPRQLRHPPLPPAARARRRAGAGAASLPVADQRSACGSWWRRRKLLSIGQLSGGFPQLSSAPHGQLGGGFPQHRSPGFGHQPVKTMASSRHEQHCLYKNQLSKWLLLATSSITLLSHQRFMIE